MAARMLVRGEYRIEPPLKWVQIKESSFLPSDRGGSQVSDVVLQLTEEERETDEGVFVTVTCDKVAPWTASTCDPVNLLDSVKDLVAECAGHNVTGEMIAYDTEYLGYVTRVIVDDEGAREERARLVWPDGSEAESLN
jgi:Family of unknown function (DUF6205)